MASHQVTPPSRARGTNRGFVLAAVLLPLLLGPTAACGPDVPAADLVLRNGKVVTLDGGLATAEALAAAGDTVLAVGSEAEIDSYVTADTRVVDLDGRLAVPGFVESHGHFMGMGSAQMQLDLMDAPTWERIVAMVDSAADAAEPGQWIRGRGWHQEKWGTEPARTVLGYPTHDELTRAAARNPVLLTHASGHASVVNARAMELAGIEAETPDPEGGEIVRDPEGRPTGVLLDAAEGLAHAALEEARAEMSEEERARRRRRQAELAAREAVSKGVTSFHDQGASLGTLALYRELAEEGALPLRLYVLVSQREFTPEQADTLAALRTVDGADGHLTVRAVGEVSSDGALGSRSAWMLEPYRDRSGYTGLEVTSMERVREIADIALRTGYQVAAHAIGDRANRETLDLFAALFDSAGVEGDTLRWRIEHAQHLHPEDIPRFAELGVVASMQGIHACSDAPYVIRRLGEERAREGAYVWKSLWESGAVVTNGTDAPVEDVDPLASFHCTVTREIVGAPGDSTFFPAESLTREETLRSYTVNGAYAAFQEEKLGTLAPGTWADVAVLSRDVLTAPEDSIPGTSVDYTVVGGEVVYERPGSP